MNDYLWGLVTIPAVVAVMAALVFACFWVSELLRSHGFTFSARWSRGVKAISEYTLRHDIWWERPFGPVFVGGWYREKPVYREPTTTARFGRWVGLGSADGPCVIAFYTRDLGEVPA